MSEHSGRNKLMSLAILGNGQTDRIGYLSHSYVNWQCNIKIALPIL